MQALWLLSLLLLDSVSAQFGFNFGDLIGPAIAVATNKGSKVSQATQVAQAVSGVFFGNGQQQQGPPPPQQGGFLSQYGGGSSGSNYGGFSPFGSALGPSPSSSSSSFSSFGRPSSSSFGGSQYGGSSSSFGSSHNSFGGSSSSFGSSPSSFGEPSSSFSTNSRPSHSSIFGPTSSFGGSGGIKSSTPSSFGDYEDGSSFGRKREVSSFGSAPPPEVVGGTGGLKNHFVNPFPNRPRQPSGGFLPRAGTKRATSTAGRRRVDGERRQHVVRNPTTVRPQPHAKPSQRIDELDFELLNHRAR